MQKCSKSRGQDTSSKLPASPQLQKNPNLLYNPPKTHVLMYNVSNYSNYLGVKEPNLQNTRPRTTVSRLSVFEEESSFI